MITELWVGIGTGNISLTLTSLAYLLLTLITSIHILLRTENSRSRMYWLGLVWFSPLIGVVFYYFLGLNRIQRKAVKFRKRHAPLALPISEKGPLLHPWVEVGNRLKLPEPTYGNHCEPLISGEKAYPRMLECIENSKKTVFLMAYIFDRDATGRKFVEALARAQKRGVVVRVLIDDLGAGRGFFESRITKWLRELKITYGVFFPAHLPWTVQYLNLRNHRKLLIVDGEVAFTGGMNFSSDYDLGAPSSLPTLDFMVEMRGSIVDGLLSIFFHDWEFATKEDLSSFANNDSSSGPTSKNISRIVPSGPDLKQRSLEWLLASVFSGAREKIQIMVPYFLPPESIVATLVGASLRGVRVELLLPAKSDNRWIDRARMPLLEFLIGKGVHVYLSPAPFNHSKLVLVDEAWSCFGSANLDMRSFQLNFELNIETYDIELFSKLSDFFNEVRTGSKQIDTNLFQHLSASNRLLNSAASIFAPLL